MKDTLAVIAVASLMACKSETPASICFYAEELKSAQNAQELVLEQQGLEGVMEARRTLAQHRARHRPVPSGASVTKRDLVRVRVDTGLTLETLLERLRRNAPAARVQGSGRSTSVHAGEWYFELEPRGDVLILGKLLHFESGAGVPAEIEALLHALDV